MSEENKILPTDYVVPAEARNRYRNEYGSAYEQAVARVAAAEGKSLLSLFKLPTTGKIKTELLFIERCLDLLEPGGRLGIVLPEGVFNNTNDLNVRVREFVENRAQLNAVVSLAADTFKSSGADVKCSLLFLTKFTVKDQKTFDDTHAKALKETEAKYAPEIERETKRLTEAIDQANKSFDRESRKMLRAELEAFEDRMAETIEVETRALLKKRFPYPVFLYEAEKVGITATGDPDENELYPNDRKPAACEKTCLELYNEFKKDPKPFFVVAPVN